MKKYYTNINPMVAKILTICMMCVVSLQAVAQQYYPVVARFTQLPPYPVYLADFSNPAQTNLSIQIQQNDRTIATRPIRIRVYIEGQGFQIQSVDVVQDEPPLVLNYGQVYNLPSQQVANYFKQYNLKVSPDQYRQPFSEGSFRFGVEIIDVQTSKAISGVQWASPVWITVNEPPVWVQPKNELVEKPMTPQNVTFQWAPRHNNIGNVEYEFSMTEIITNNGIVGNVQNLFLGQPTFYKTRTQGTILNFNATMPPLVAGRAYAYRVQAIAKRGYEDVGIFRNNGYSEVQYFKYGEFIPDTKPPTNLKITRNETNTGANFEWKGELDHKNFTVEYREKGSQGTWTTANVKAGAGNVYNSYNIAKLDENKNYELRVVGINEGNKSATSAPISLDIVANSLKKEPDIAIQGTVQWAYYASEEKVKENTKIIDAATSTTLPARDIKHDTFEQQKGSRKYLLENAFVTLFSSEDASITTQNYKEKIGTGIIKRIETVSSDASGQFKFKAMNIKLLADVKNLYVLTTYKDVNVFNYEIVKISIDANATETKTLEPITILANSLRFSPKILVEQTAVTTTKVEQRRKFIPWRMVTEEVRVPTTGMAPIDGSLTTDNVEEIGLYRLQSTIAKNPYLKHEGSADVTRSAIKFNNDTYIKVADFTNTATTSAQLFYNKAYNDSFVLRIKQKEREEVLYPVNNIEAFQEAKYAHVTDYFKYTPPLVKLKGYVERRGKTKVERLANVAVQAFGTTFRTNGSGYFETQIPLTTERGSKIILNAIDPLNATNKVADTITYNLENITRTLVLKEGAHYVSSVVYDGYTKKPLGGAMVTYNGTTAKTDSSGVFRFVVDGDKMVGSIKVVADGYTQQELDTKVLKTTLIGGSNTAEKTTDWLKSIGLKFKDEKESSAFFADNYTKLDRQPSTNFIKDSVSLNSEVKFRILTYTEKRSKAGVRNLVDSVTYVASVLKINGAEKNVSIGGYKRVDDKPKERIGTLGFYKASTPKESFGGYTDKTTAKTITVQVANKDATKETYLESEVTFTMPTKVKKDSVYTFSYRLRPTKLMHGIVYDSTMFIKGVHKEGDATVNLPGKPFIVLGGANVAVENGDSTKSDANGFFKLMVPADGEVAFEVTKKGYATTKTTVSDWDPDSYKLTEDKKTRQSFYIVQSDPSIPKFTTLLGFDIKLDKSVINSASGGGKTFKISGKIKLKTGKAVSTNIYTADKTTELTFKDIEVKSQDEDKGKNNAVTVLTSVNLVETEAEIKLFGYAPITLKGNHAGEPFIRLNHLLGKPGEGKIGASELEFTQKTMLGIKFGEMELKAKAPEKEKGFGKTDDKVSKDKEKSELYKEQVALEKELATKKDEKKTAETEANKQAVVDAKASLAEAQKAQKETNKTGSADDKKAMADLVDGKKKAVAADKYAADGPTQVPEKEPLMLAFATSALEELRDDVEFSIEFKKKAKEGEDFIKFPLGSVDLSPVGLGNRTTSALGVSVIEVLIDKSSAVLKKSGIGMKGNVRFPQIWKFKTDKPLIIEKLDIDKEFGLKQINFMKGDKGHIYSFGMADSWMFYITTFQIYNNFKGYGIGGTFNTDKDNYFNVKSFGMSVVNGRVYPNVELNTPEAGVRFSKVRFKTMGKKSISWKGNPADQSYEVEASLRLEYDDSEVVSTALTETTDKYGKLQPSIVEANKIEAEIEAKEKSLVKEKQGLDKSYASALDKQNKAKTASEKEKAAAEITKLDGKRSDWLTQVKKHDDDTKTKNEKIGKLKEEAKKLSLAADSVVNKKKELAEAAANKKKYLADSLKGDAANKLVENANKVGYKAATEAAAKDAAKDAPKEAPKGGLNWKDRLFPLTLQVFQWSTSGKLLVSAAPSANALSFGPVNVKIRRIVYTRARDKKGEVKLSVIEDLLKLTEEEAAKLNSTTNFNDANTMIADGKREGVLSKETQKERETVSSAGLTVKALADKVAAEDPSASWGMGFAGGIEITSSFKGLKFDSDLSMTLIGTDKGTQFKLNEIMLKLDGTGFRVMGKVKIATSGKKVGMEGAVDFEAVKQKFAASFKFYKIDADPEAKKPAGIEIGASLQVSAYVPMGPVPITWTSLGGGFDFNTVDRKYKVFFLGSAVTTGVPEKVVALKNIVVSLEFDAIACGGLPVIKGTSDLWTNDEEFGKVSMEYDFCRWRIIQKLSVKKEIAKTMVQLNALVIISKAGLFAGAMAEAEVLGFKANGIIAIGALCKTTSPDMPTELAEYKRKLPTYLYQSDNVTFSGIYIGFELGKEMKDEGKFGIGPVKVASYAIELKIKGEASIGVNFSNGNFMIKSGLDMNLEAKVSVLSFNINGTLRLVLKLEGGYTNDIGWNFLAQTYGNLSVYNDGGSNLACNDYRVAYEYGWENVCVKRKIKYVYPGKCIKTESRWVRKAWIIPDKLEFKRCYNWNFGVRYRQRGSEQGWKFMR
jgi:hypothetical protein